jgi:NADH-quinone oxidoreductase subunit J
MLLDQIIFFIFAAIALAGAVLVVTSRNAVHSAIWLITTLLATAGIYLLLQAEFLFAVQIILYVGGIVVLFIFVIMLVNLDVAVRQIQFNRQTPVALILALAVGGMLPVAHYFLERQIWLPPERVAPMGPNTEQVGQVLFSQYMVPFEIASVLLLVAMIGAVVMAKRRV